MLKVVNRCRSSLSKNINDFVKSIKLQQRIGLLCTKNCITLYYDWNITYCVRLCYSVRLCYCSLK